MQARSSLTGIVIVLTGVCLVIGAATGHDDTGLPRPDLRRGGPTLNVVATLEHYGSIAKVIGGERVKVSVIVKGSQNPTRSPSSRATRCSSTRPISWSRTAS